MIWVILELLFAVLTIFLLLILCVKRFTTYNLAKSMPGAHMYPVIGAIDYLFSSQREMFETGLRFCKMYANGFVYWTFGYFIYHIYTAEKLEKIVMNPKHIEKSVSYKFLNNFLGTGLLTSAGEKWQHRRKLLTPAFHFNVLNGFYAIFDTNTKLLISTIRKDELNRPGGTHIQQLISRFTLNTICESAMDVKLKRIDELDEYRERINQLGELLVERMTKPIFMIDWAYNLFGGGKLERKYVQEMHEFTGNIIGTKRKLFQTNQNCISVKDEVEMKQRFAMLDTLLLAEQNGGKIDAAGIQEEVDTFVFEGFDTTMTAITFILFMIANHSDVQQRLYEEIKSVDNHRDYNNLKYLDAVIKETMRLYPPVPFIGRVLGEETEIDNVKLPPKTIIHILIFALHRDPRYFKNPNDFEPNRFLDESFENGAKHPFAYVPFSAGQRNCIGQKFAMMELKTCVGEIVRNFQLRPITHIDDIVIISDLILRSKDPIRLQFVPRFE